VSQDLATLPAAGRAPLPALRWIGLAALLIGEVLALTLRYDTGTLAGNSSWWAELMGQSHLLPKLLAAAGTAVLVLGGTRVVAELRRLAEQTVEPRAALLYLAGHLAAFAALTRVTGLLLDGDANALPCPGAWVVGWFVLALTTFALWVAVAVPPGLWPSLARRGSGLLAIGIAVGCAAWGIAQLTTSVWQPLGTGTLYAVRGLLALVVRDPVCDLSDFTIGTRAFAVQIAPSCSGYEGIGMIWAVLALFLWGARQELRFPHALLLLPLGTAVIWAANVVRIAALIGVGTWGSAAVATGAFHSQAGWLAFNAVGLGLVAVARRARFFAATGCQPTAAKPADRTAAYLAPLLAVVAAAMISGAFSNGFDQLYLLRVFAGVAALWYFRRDYAGMRWGFSGSALGLGVVAFAIWMVLEPAASFTAGQGARPAGLLGASSAWVVSWLAFRVIGSVLVVPLVEELAFRGYLTRRLMATEFESVPPGRFAWFSFLVSSVVFGLVHGDRWVAGVVAGMLYALALYRRGRVADAVLAHATTNGLIAAYALATESWALWA